MVNLLWVAVAVPVVSCLLLALGGERLGARAIGLIACGSIFISFVLVLLAFLDLIGLAAGDRARVSGGWTWLEAGNFDVRARLLLDPLSALLALIVSGVGGLIHVYAVGYMEGDAGYARFFAELNGFIAAMLLLTFRVPAPMNQTSGCSHASLLSSAAMGWHRVRAWKATPTLPAWHSPRLLRRAWCNRPSMFTNPACRTAASCKWAQQMAGHESARAAFTRF